MGKLNSGGNAAATNSDITGILGPIDTDKLFEILSLHPTIAEVEEAAMWLSGGSDVFGVNPPVKGNASHIVTILTAEQEEEQR